MNSFRANLAVLYAYLVVVALVLTGAVWSQLTNPFFGMRFTNAPAWFDVGAQWLGVALATAGTIACLLCCWALARRNQSARRLTLTIAWLILFFYAVPDVLLYMSSVAMLDKHAPFLVLVGYKTILLFILSIAALVIWRSKRFRGEYTRNPRTDAS